METINFFEARKLLETTKEGEIEIKKFHVLELKNEDIHNLINLLYDLLENEDDYESMYYDGICVDMDGDLYYIDTEDFLENWIKEKIKEEEATKDKNEDLKKNLELVKSFMEKYDGYTLYFKREEKKD